jgi:hypothetical protein
VVHLEEVEGREWEPRQTTSYPATSSKRGMGWMRASTRGMSVPQPCLQARVGAGIELAILASYLLKTQTLLISMTLVGIHQ